MKESKFIVVTDKPYLDTRNFGSTTISKMKVLDNETKVLDYILSVGRKEGDPRTVKNIFSVDESANVVNWEIVFEGKLKLKIISQEDKNGL